MGILSNLEPQRVFDIFEELCSIPHGSFNTKQISDYILSFAQKRGLKCRQDAVNNVVIWKEATKGYENYPTVMLQGHMDMVCEKDADCNKDMDKEGLDLFVDGDKIGAKGTTLGGDDCIAVAMGLAILESEEIPHGPLECVFTVDEEVGMTGVRFLDTSDLHSKYLINVDSEKERVLTVSCAGSCRYLCHFDAKRENFEGTVLEVKVTGLMGGHSGEEIHLGRGNSNVSMGRTLYELSKACNMRLISIAGGAKDNAIPRESIALVAVDDVKAAKEVVTRIDKELQQEYKTADKEIRLLCKESSSEKLPLCKEDTDKFICFLHCAPTGIQEMSMEVPGLVQTSLNMGRLFTEENCITASFMIRSNVNTQKDLVASRLEAFTKILGGTTEMPSTYSAWEFNKDSKLREVMVDVYTKQYGEAPAIEALHGGLECGILSGKMPGLDCVSICPDITEFHTPRERLHIASTQRTWKFILETLKNLKD